MTSSSQQLPIHSQTLLQQQSLQQQIDPQQEIRVVNVVSVPAEPATHSITPTTVSSFTGVSNDEPTIGQLIAARKGVSYIIMEIFGFFSAHKFSKDGYRAIVALLLRRAEK